MKSLIIGDIHGCSIMMSVSGFEEAYNKKHAAGKPQILALTRTLDVIIRAFNF